MSVQNWVGRCRSSYFNAYLNFPQITVFFYYTIWMSLVTGLVFLVRLLNHRWSPPLRLQVIIIIIIIIIIIHLQGQIEVRITVNMQAVRRVCRSINFNTDWIICTSQISSFMFSSGLFLNHQQRYTFSLQVSHTYKQIENREHTAIVLMYIERQRSTWMGAWIGGLTECWMDGELGRSTQR
jgi:hypothetical protein